MQSTLYLQTKLKADKVNKKHIGAIVPGTVLKVLVGHGEKEKKGHLSMTEAMAMETTVQAPITKKGAALLR